MENVDAETLRSEDGVEQIKQLIIDAYEPIEDYRVGKIMDEFLDDFWRKKDQEIVDDLPGNANYQRLKRSRVN